MIRLPSRSNALRRLSSLPLALVGLALVTGAAHAAGDLEAGRKKMRMCQVCHGADGIGTNPTVPNLAGESAVYLKKQLIAFKTGKREHEQMSIIAKGLSDEDIENVAAYYSAIKVSVELP